MILRAQRTANEFFGTLPDNKARLDETELGTSGWSEAYAKDGYALRCDWSRVGCKEEMQFVELFRRRASHGI
jgi:hypothetical protein